MKKKIKESSKEIRCSGDLSDAEYDLVTKVFKGKFRVSLHGYCITSSDYGGRDTYVWTTSVGAFDAWKEYYDYMKSCGQVSSGINLVDFVLKELENKKGARLVVVDLVPRKKNKK